jgi:putative transposase
MATFRRSTTPGATYFFTVNTDGRLAVLTAEPFYRALQGAMREVKATHPFVINAFVVLPDHLHCIWTLPPGDADYPGRWSIIKRLVSQGTRALLQPPAGASRRARGELGLWQRRYWEHQIRDDQDFERHANYIHWNPVKHGYAASVAQWPYSSFARYVARGIYPVDWAGVAPAGESKGKYGEAV